VPDRRPIVLVYAAVAGLLLLVLGLGSGEAYWSYSEGVYAMTAREWLHGLEPYRDVALAQPPGVVWVGAAILGVLGDSVTGLRIGTSLVELVTGGLVALAVARLTGRGWVAFVAGVAALVAPWTLHERAVLTPETLGAPLLLGAALLAARERTAAVAGAVAALAVACKLPFLLPVAALALAAADRRRYAAGAIAGLAVLTAVVLLVHGTDVVDQTVRAQRETGLNAARDLGGYLAQATWNLGPLVLLAALAWPYRARALDPRLLGTLAALLGGCLLLAGSLFKDGSSLNVITPAEPPAVALAAAGLAWAWSAGGNALLRAASAALVALLLAQSAALLLSPQDPRPFTRPGSDNANGRVLSDGGVRAVIAKARVCPPGVAYTGPPYLAFAADRRMPGDQPDEFIVNESERLRAFRRHAVADQPRCP
jgi:Dolichyl-phosphate-mannose-protein mannosyltransferase